MTQRKIEQKIHNKIQASLEDFMEYDGIKVSFYTDSLDICIMRTGSFEDRYFANGEEITPEDIKEHLNSINVGRKIDKVTFID